jgi:hypothetical protein
LSEKRQEISTSIVSVSGVDLNAYRQNSSFLREQVVFCQLCANGLRRVKLWKNGSYPKHVPCGKPGETIRMRIFRKLCPECRTSFSLHPEFLLNRQAYSLTFVAAWLWAFLTRGTAIRDRIFLEAFNVRLPDNDPKMSWSDSLDYPGQRTRPGYQLLRYWSVLFCFRAKALLPELVEAFTAGQYLRSLAEGWQGPDNAKSLQLAWLHWEALWRSRSPKLEIDTEEAFRQFIRFLSKAPSHKMRRAAGGRYPYDVIIR